MSLSHSNGGQEYVEHGKLNKRLQSALQIQPTEQVQTDPEQQQLARILQQELKSGGHEYMFDPDETRAWIFDLWAYCEALE